MILIYTTVGTKEQYESIANTLLDERLIACVNSWPIESKFVWKGKLQNYQETAMLLKTTDSCQEAVYHRLYELHPYDCPAIITLTPTEANPAFVHWINASTDH